jgi:hypothetical protein
MSNGLKSHCLRALSLVSALVSMQENFGVSALARSHSV